MYVIKKGMQGLLELHYNEALKHSAFDFLIFVFGKQLLVKII